MDLKRMAAERAAEFLPGTRVLGLGSGSTTARFIEVLAEHRRRGAFRDLVAIPTSVCSGRMAERLSIPLSSLDDNPQIDLTVDGADEVDPHLDLIKGHGGALTREKIVACASRQLVIIVDDSKMVEQLGSKMALPVEVVQFGWRAVQAKLADLGARGVLRTEGEEPYRTDQDNFVLDCRFGGAIVDPVGVARALIQIPGVVEHGLFLDMAQRVVVASQEGVRVLDRPDA
ncbi:MAG: ribose-5-phosphate isomerase RpiA [Acidobacteriota bacterium]